MKLRWGLLLLSACGAPSAPSWVASADNPSGCPTAEASCVGDRSGSCPMGLSCRYEHPSGSFAVQTCGGVCKTYNTR